MRKVNRRKYFLTLNAENDSYSRQLRDDCVSGQRQLQLPPLVMVTRISQSTLVIDFRRMFTAFNYESNARKNARILTGTFYITL